MDLTARRDGFYMIKEEKQEEAFTQTDPSFFPNLAPSSSSPSATAPFGWRVGQFEISAAAGRSGADGSSESKNFFSAKEHMFDKVLTPSDVGKLNRLVIPKQYAEQYFPLDPAANDKGMLLSFEDRTGKSWRFRYSYWNSSQSYVMTKGWSRFVKDKRLDAGDVVSFGRGLGELGSDHFYIDWKRRPNNHHQPRLPLAAVSLARSMGPWIGGNGTGRYFNVPLAAAYDHHRRRQVFGGYGGASGGGGQFLYLRSSMAGPPQLGLPHSSGAAAPMVLDSLPLVRNKAAAAKRVRLFGVNLDCSEPEGNARLPKAASAISSWSPASPTIPFLSFAYGGTEASSSAVSPLRSKQHHLTLDLNL